MTRRTFPAKLVMELLSQSIAIDWDSSSITNFAGKVRRVIHLIPHSKTVRVQRCGKSAPATSRGVGSVNPGRKQGRRSKGAGERGG
ncbi:hypothetical protein [Leptolyngbya ohadii]|uniref:hypothetical protein n=1 Tax=Leptolyngbya ohadii TaxID=1962290 RepID=UPI0015C61589|nr:hypothetical protein [Leptolyngbya ohadii]